MLGSDAHYPEEAPVHEAAVGAFGLEAHPVTNQQFAAFVADTGYVTEAERAPDRTAFPGADPALLVPGGLVFTPTAGPVPLDDWQQWWTWTPGASWQHPRGPGSTLQGLAEHPVVMVSAADAEAYAAWAGRRLPSEAEWEYAAWGLQDAGAGRPGEYAWGVDLTPGGKLMANTWQGYFPYRNLGAAGWTGTSPVGAFPANGFGLVDMIGNVWEWTASAFAPRESLAGEAGGAAEADGAGEPSCCPHTVLTRELPTRAVKGGSFLCAPEYCRRYRPAARSAQTTDSATSHLGFRCAV